MIIQACPTSSETFDTNRCKLTNSHLGPALKALDDSTRNPRILISHELLQHELVLQYSGNSTLQIRCDQLLENINKIQRSQIVDFSASTNEEIMPLATSSSKSPIESPMLDPLLTKGINNLRHSTSTGISKAVNTSHMAFTNGELLARRMNETSQRLGYMNEEMWRLHLARKEGEHWARRVHIQSLEDLVKWIGTEISATKGECIAALDDLIRI